MAIIFLRYGMTPAHIPVLLSQTPNTKNRINRPANLFLFFVWFHIWMDCAGPCHEAKGTLAKKDAASWAGCWGAAGPYEDQNQ